MKINTDKLQGLISGGYALEMPERVTWGNVDKCAATFKVALSNDNAKISRHYKYHYITDGEYYFTMTLPAGMEAKPLSFFFEEEDCSEVTLDNTNDEDPVYKAPQPYVQTYSSDSIAPTGLNLPKLAAELDEALDKETPESLKEYLVKERIVEPLEEKKKQMSKEYIAYLGDNEPYLHYVLEPKNRAKIELFRDIEQWCKNNEIKDKWNVIPIMFSISENPKHPMIAQFNPKSLTAYELFKDRLHLLID